MALVELSILIPTMPSRLKCFSELISELNRQIIDCNAAFTVEIITDDSMEYNIGVKRNKLLDLANGTYIAFCDDDDRVHSNYVNLILEAIKSDADCIAFNGVMSTNKTNYQQWFISKEYGRWFTENNIHYRTPNHISPVKRNLALLAGFPPISFGEDFGYSERLYPLLKTETVINEPLYFYDYITSKTI